jgi:carboxylesterase type B
VNATSGVVQGHTTSLAPEVSEYLGIPYGKSTTGDLRFAAPVMYVGDETISGANYVSYVL